MEKNMSRLLVETVVRNSLKSIRENPEREIRNLVDMALQFSEGRFQKNFFTIAQTMLQNEDSAYYDLIRNIVFHTETDRLHTFGMNLGYNSCTRGAQMIRDHEAAMACRIPWSLSIQIDPQKLTGNYERYELLIHDGERLGIFTWMLFPSGCVQTVLPLVREHPDSAFCIFCEARSLTPAFLDEAEGIHNIMLVVRYDEKAVKKSPCSGRWDSYILYGIHTARRTLRPY